MRPWIQVAYTACPEGLDMPEVWLGRMKGDGFLDNVRGEGWEAEGLGLKGTSLHRLLAQLLLECPTRC